MTPMLRVLVCALTCCVAAHAATLTLNPVGGLIEGAPGAKVGWGFTLLNPNDYLIVTSSDFQTVNPIGVYTDTISPQFVVVGAAPESSFWTQDFDSVLDLGVGSVTISPAAAPGAESIGVILLTYDLYSVSPNDPGFDPGLHLISSGLIATADATVRVSSSGPEVPEPSTLLAVALPLLLLFLRDHCLRKNTTH